MEESKRQKQVAKLVLEEISDIFQREGVNVVDGGLVSVSKVYVTPDLLEARIYLSLYQVKDTDGLMKKIRERSWEFRKLLGQRTRNQLRRVPDLSYEVDDALDNFFKMEEVFKKINEEREKFKPSTE